MGARGRGQVPGARQGRPGVGAEVSRDRVGRGDLALCVDEVHGLGAFLELERLVPDDTAGEPVQAELVSFVESLDVVVERTEETYDSLVRATQEIS